MLGRILLDDEDFCVSLGLFGGLRVFYKARRITRSCSRDERAVFHAIVAACVARGAHVAPGQPWMASLCRELAHAMLVPGTSVLWRVFFLRMAPDEHAALHVPAVAGDRA